MQSDDEKKITTPEAQTKEETKEDETIPMPILTSKSSLGFIEMDPFDQFQNSEDNQKAQDLYAREIGFSYVIQMLQES